MHHLRGLPLLLALLPLGYLVWFIGHCCVDLPFWDQFAVVDWLRQDANGSLGIEQLWVPHNVHRIVLPKIVAVSLAKATGWDTRFELVATLVAAGSGFVLVAWLCKGCGRWTLPAVATLWFSTSTWEIWLWGFLTCLPLCLLGVVLAVTGLARTPRSARWLLLAFAGGAIATLSFGAGPLIWPLGVVVLAVAPGVQPQRRSILVAVWSLVGAAVVATYLHGLQPHGPVAPEGTSAENALQFAMAHLGGPLSPRNAASALALGAAGCVAWFTLLALWRRAPEAARSAALPALALGAFGIAATILTGIGRSVGPPTFITSRYLAFTGCLWISILAASGSLLAHRRAHACLALALTLAVVWQAPANLTQGQAHRDKLVKLRDRVRRGDWSQPSLSALNPQHRAMVDALAFMRERRLSTFRDYDASLEVSHQPAPCGLEASYERPTPGAGRLVLRQPEFALRQFRCLFSLSPAPATRLADGRLIPLAMDPLYLESMRPDSAFWRGHQARFDSQGCARIDVLLPERPHAVRVYYSLHLVDEGAAFSIATICQAGSFEH